MTVRAALVGTGSWAQSALLPALRSLDGVEVVACVGETDRHARDFAARNSIARATSGLDALFAEAGAIDLLVIATPDALHAPMTKAGIAAGVAVYCEKPLANEAADAAALADLAEAAGVAATVGYSFRYNPAVQALRTDLRTGRLGKPWLIELYEHNPQFHPSSGKAMNWKGDPASAKAGALFEYGSHAVDLAMFLVGPVRRVSSGLSRVLPNARLDDIATLQLEFEPPTRGMLIASWVLAGGFPGIRIRLHGALGLGEVQIDEGIPGGQSYRRLPLSGFGGEFVALDQIKELRSDATRRHLADFVAGLRGQRSGPSDTLPTLRVGAQVQDVLEAALAASDRWIAIADVDPGGGALSLRQGERRQ